MGKAFKEFTHSQISSGILLIICTISALIWANSPYATGYFHINDIKLAVNIGNLHLEKNLQHWVNDGLMSIFFLLVGLEIKREVLTGELSSIQKASLPIFAALGGMLVPALIYVACNWHDKAALSGWAIPMATDIAFALGVVALLGKRISKTFFVLLAAIAIVDDIGAILVIAVFYSDSLILNYLAYAVICCVVLGLCNYFKVRKLVFYILVGVLLWYCILKSGIHATIAGVLLAFLIPHDTYKKEKKSPLESFESILHLPVNYLIIPVFVLLNAGVAFTAANLHEAYSHSITLGIIFGLLAGKMIGIFSFSAAAVKLKLAELPAKFHLRHIVPLSIIAGIGFTMAIFISELAFPENPEFLMLAKMGILSASLVAAIVGYLMMFFMSKKTAK
ncbi:MAG: Na+/H+ antiporter NhaA [Thiotrichales bacterium]|nr:MAG: Na+/H+ antiporter NhaA [Thiotrichales bacterium]